MERTTQGDAGARGRHPSGGPWLAPNPAADYLGVKRTTIYELMKTGAIAWSPVGSRRRISVAELDRYMKAQARRARQAS